MKQESLETDSADEPPPPLLTANRSPLDNSLRDMNCSFALESMEGGSHLVEGLNHAMELSECFGSPSLMELNCLREFYLYYIMQSFS